MTSPDPDPRHPLDRWDRTVLSERVGDRLWELEALDGFEANLARLYRELGGRGGPRWRVDMSPMFGVIWGSARALCARLDALGPALRDRTVLELACGLALPSLVAARHGARATATDLHPDTPAFLERNLARNGVGGVAWSPLDLRAPEASPLAGQRFDRVVASDVLYAFDLPAPVARSIARFLAPDGVAWLVDPGRAWLDEFLAAAADQGLRCALEVDAVPAVPGEPHPGEVFVVEMRYPPATCTPAS